MTTHASQAELVRVGEALCLFRPDNHAAALLNASAASLCSTILDGMTRGDLPEDSPQNLISLHRQLADAGFLDAAAPAASRHGVPPRLAQFERPVSGFRVGHGPRVSLTCDDPALRVLLDAALSPLRVDIGETPNASIEVTFEDGNFSVWRDGCCIDANVAFPTARRVVLQTLLMALLPPGRVTAILHASSVSAGGRAVLLAGATGSGKSTLSMSLVAAGCGYIADDLTALDASGRGVSTYPLAASIKSGSWDLIGQHFPALLNSAIHQVGSRQVRYLDLSDRASNQQIQPVAAIFFPEYRPNAEPGTERLSPEAALSQLLQSGSEIVGESRSIQPVANLVNTTPAWRLTFTDTGWARDAVLARVASA